MTLKRDTPCQGGCGKVRSILYSDSPADWLCNDCRTKKIRPYGPGKFSTILDSYVYGVSLDGGCDDEESNSDAGIWYGLMRNGRTIFRDHDPFLDSLNGAEREQLTSSAGVILYQDSNGFVYVSYYATDDELNAEWAKVVADFAEPDDEEDENRVTCPQCELLAINGVACHETGCPNMGARWDAESGEWIKQRKCFDCGCTVDADDECCNGEEN